MLYLLFGEFVEASEYLTVALQKNMYFLYVGILVPVVELLCTAKPPINPIHEFLE